MCCVCVAAEIPPHLVAAVGLVQASQNHWRHPSKTKKKNQKKKSRVKSSAGYRLICVKRSFFLSFIYILPSVCFTVLFSCAFLQLGSPVHLWFSGRHGESMAGKGRKHHLPTDALEAGSEGVVDERSMLEIFISNQTRRDEEAEARRVREKKEQLEAEERAEARKLKAEIAAEEREELRRERAKIAEEERIEARALEKERRKIEESKRQEDLLRRSEEMTRKAAERAAELQEEKQPEKHSNSKRSC